MVSVSNLLRQPYPYYFSQKSLGAIAAGVFLLSFLFVLFFEPFNVNPAEHRFSYGWISILHAACSSLVLYLCFSIWNLFRPREEDWTVSREIISLSVVLLFMGVGNFLLRDLIYDNPNNWSFGYLFEEVRNTFLVGILLILVLVPLNFLRNFNTNIRQAAALHPEPSETTISTSTTIPVQTQLKSDDFILEPGHFLFARAEGNYLEFYFDRKQGQKKELKRMSIKLLESQLENYPQLLRIHRSYIVNLEKVTKVKGNAQGYQLSLQNFAEELPVSRSYLPAFRSSMVPGTL